MNCYLHGYFWTDNFGDYLLYDITRDSIDKVFSTEDLFSANVSTSYDRYHVVNRKKTFDAVKTADCAILTGGGYFGEPKRFLHKHYENVNFILKQGIPLSILAKRKVPYIIVGLGIGPLSWPISKRFASYILNNAKSIAVRDIESKEYAINKLKVKKDIMVLPDMVMGCASEKYLSEEQWAEEQFVTRDKVHIALHLTTKHKENGKGLDVVIKDIKKLIKDNPNKYDLYMICDQARQKQVDRAENIAKLLGVTSYKVIPYETPHKLCSLLSKMNVIVTDKLHVGIVAVKLNKYVISVAGHIKIKRFYNQVGREKYCELLENVKEGYVYNLIEEYKELEKSENMSIIEQQSMENQKIVENFLSSTIGA